VERNGPQDDEASPSVGVILEDPAMIRHRLVPMLLIATCLSQLALAQINPFRGSSGAPLNATGITALADSPNRPLDRPELVIGGTEAWSSPQSGASGTVTAGDVVQREGLACRVLSYQHTIPGPNPQRTAMLTWCKTQDGWKIG